MSRHLSDFDCIAVMRPLVDSAPRAGVQLVVHNSIINSISESTQP